MQCSERKYSNLTVFKKEFQLSIPFLQRLFKWDEMEGKGKERK